MITLGKALQETIRNFEKIRDAQDLPSDKMLAHLDRLYDQQIDLIDAAIQKDTEEYKTAAASMQEAAKKTKEAIDDLAKLEKSVEKVANAIGKVSGLLAKVT